MDKDRDEKPAVFELIECMRQARLSGCREAMANANHNLNQHVDGRIREQRAAAQVHNVPKNLR